MILLKSCPLCGQPALTKQLNCTDYTKSLEKFTIVSCETCGFTFTNPRPEDSKIGEYYKSEMYISHTNSKQGLFNWLYQKVRSYSIQKKVGLLKKTAVIGKHLDIGCGTGEFLNACAKAGFKTEGVEPSPIARKQAVDNYNLSVNDNTDLSMYKKSEFNSITMWHVLEHITDLHKTLFNINRILSDNGRLVIAVPNHKSWDAHYYKEYWAAWDVPIHLWHFSQDTIEKLLNKNNFKLVLKKGMIFDSYYVSILSEEFKSGRKSFIMGLIIGLASNLFGLLTKRGYSSMIYVFEKKNKHLKQL